MAAACSGSRIGFLSLSVLDGGIKPHRYNCEDTKYEAIGRARTGQVSPLERDDSPAVKPAVLPTSARFKHCRPLASSPFARESMLELWICPTCRKPSCIRYLPLLRPQGLPTGQQAALYHGALFTPAGRCRWDLHLTAGTEAVLASERYPRGSCRTQTTALDARPAHRATWTAHEVVQRPESVGQPARPTCKHSPGIFLWPFTGRMSFEPPVVLFPFAAGTGSGRRQNCRNRAIDESSVMIERNLGISIH